MKVLLDTCVLSELRHPKGDASVKTQVTQLTDEQLFLSVLTIGEIAKGIALLTPSRKKQSLSLWLNEFEANFAERILPITLTTVHLWGELTARAQKSGDVIPATDGLLAATALEHGMQLITRNTKHFKATGVLIIDPWQKIHKADCSTA